jgi:hypothetical protein
MARMGQMRYIEFWWGSLGKWLLERERRKWESEMQMGLMDGDRLGPWEVYETC